MSWREVGTAGTCGGGSNGCCGSASRCEVAPADAPRNARNGGKRTTAGDCSGSSVPSRGSGPAGTASAAVVRDRRVPIRGGSRMRGGRCTGAADAGGSRDVAVSSSLRTGGGEESPAQGASVDGTLGGGRLETLPPSQPEESGAV